MFCPSTGEIIVGSGQDGVNERAGAFIAYWHGDALDKPHISDVTLRIAWDAFNRRGGPDSDDADLGWDAVDRFLADYEYPAWVVYKCIFHGLEFRPTSATIYFVVRADTIVEKASDRTRPAVCSHSISAPDGSGDTKANRSSPRTICPICKRRVKNMVSCEECDTEVCESQCIVVVGADCPTDPGERLCPKCLGEEVGCRECGGAASPDSWVRCPRCAEITCATCAKKSRHRCDQW